MGKNIICIPTNATNGDMLVALFPTCEVTRKEDCGAVNIKKLDNWNVFCLDWWDAPYEINKFENNIINIPVNATNGDILSLVFSNCKITIDEYDIVNVIGLDGWNVFGLDWWNTPFQMIEK